MTEEWRRLPLRRKLLTAVALILAGATAAPLLVLPGRLAARDRVEELRLATDVARAVAGASEVAVDFGDRIRAGEVLDGLGKVQGAVFAQLRGADGEPLATWGAPPPRDAVGPGVVSAVHQDTLFIHAVEPVATRSGLRGALEVGFGLDGLRLRAEEARRLTALTAVVIFLAGLIVAVGLFSLIVKPLERVAEVAALIARGDEVAPGQLDGSAGGEAGAMAAALGGMAGRLVAQQAILEAQNEAVDDGLLTLGLDGRVLVRNGRLSQFLVPSPEAWAGASWSSVRDRLQPLLDAPLPAWLQLPLPVPPPGDPARLELAFRDGRCVELRSAPVASTTGVRLGVCLTLTDVSAIRRAEGQIREANAELEARVARRTAELATANQELAERIEELHQTQDRLVQADRAIAVGRLAAGVAHEINNPLAYVTANIQFVQETLDGARADAGPGTAQATSLPLEELRAALADAADGTSRVARIVRDLKAYSRPAPEDLVSTSLEHAMESALSMAGSAIRHRASLVRDFKPARPVLADEVRLAQVFLNLLLNAVHAIPAGAADRHQITVSVGTGPDGWSFAEVRDSGSGIPAAVMDRIFDPFFTTKAQGEGTGLGLSVSLGIVKGLGGRIEVRSEPGDGSVFRVVLPPARAVAASGPRPSTAPANLAGRLLVLDDEPAVGASVRRMLFGSLQVETSTDPREVLGRIAAGERYDYLLCDLMMPLMTGMEFEAELARTAPEQARRLVFMTGGAFTEVGEAFVQREAARCLDKPLDPQKLRSVLHEITRA